MSEVIARTDCRHCDPEHADPESRPWGAYVAPDRDGDGQPTHLRVAPADGAHVARSDAEWAARKLNTPPQIVYVREPADVQRAREAQHELLRRLVADLDRCEHGRHAGDSCVSCGGPSVGNRHLPPAGERIGTSLYGTPIVMPDRSARLDPAAWYPDVPRDQP